MGNTDLDTRIRMAAFEHVRMLGAAHDHLTTTELPLGFTFRGERIPLINPQVGYSNHSGCTSFYPSERCFQELVGRYGPTINVRRINRFSGVIKRSTMRLLAMIRKARTIAGSGRHMKYAIPVTDPALPRCIRSPANLAEAVVHASPPKTATGRPGEFIRIDGSYVRSAPNRRQAALQAARYRVRAKTGVTALDCSITSSLLASSSDKPTRKTAA